MPAPANDNFADRQVIFGGQGTSDPITIDDATTEVGEPTGSHVLSEHQSVWFEWTCPASHVFTFDTGQSVAGDAGSGDGDVTVPPFGHLKTTLAVWTGATLGSLVEVDSDGSTPSSVTFAGVPGTTYMIQVGTLGSPYTGTVVLNWGHPPTNDNFADARDLGSSLSGGTSFGTEIARATLEPSEPTGANVTALHNSVWYKWTPSSALLARFTATGSGGRTIAVWTGATLGSLVEVASSESGEVTFSPVIGTVYWIQVGTPTGTEDGGAALAWEQTSFTLTTSVSSITLAHAGVPVNFSFALDVLTPPHSVTVTVIETRLSDVLISYTPSRPHGAFTDDKTWDVAVTAEATTPLVPPGFVSTRFFQITATDGTETKTKSVQVFVTNAHPVVRAKENLYDLSLVTNVETDGGLRHLTGGNGQAGVQPDTSGGEESIRIGGAVQHGANPVFWWWDSFSSKVGVAMLNVGSGGIIDLGSPVWVGRADISYVPPGTVDGLGAPWLTPVRKVSFKSVQVVSDGTYLYCLALIRVDDEGYDAGGNPRSGSWNASGPNPSSSSYVIQTWRLACWRFSVGTFWEDWGWDDRTLRNDSGWASYSQATTPFFWAVGANGGAAVPGCTQEGDGGGGGTGSIDVACASPTDVGVARGMWEEYGPTNDLLVSHTDDPTIYTSLRSCRFRGAGKIPPADITEYWRDEVGATPINSLPPHDHRDALWCVLAPGGGQTGTARQLYVVGQPEGLVRRGNLDLNRRTVVGGETESAIIVADGSNEVVIPTVYDGAAHSGADATAHYVATGQNLGVFDTLGDATAYATILAERQTRYYADPAVSGRPLVALTYDQFIAATSTTTTYQEIRDLDTGDVLLSDYPSVAWHRAAPTGGSGLISTPGILTVVDPTSGGISYANWRSHCYEWVSFQAVNRGAADPPVDLTAALAAGFDPSFGVGVWGVVYSESDFYAFGLHLGERAVALGAQHVIVDAEECLKNTRPGGALPIINGLRDGGWLGPVHLSTLGSPTDPLAFDFEMDFQSFVDTGGGILPQAYSNETATVDPANCATYWQRIGVPAADINYTIGLYTGARGRFSGDDYVPLLEGAGAVTNFSIFLGETTLASDLVSLNALSCDVGGSTSIVSGPPPATAPIDRLFWDEATQLYYTFTAVGLTVRAVVLDPTGMAWDRLTRGPIDISPLPDNESPVRRAFELIHKPAIVGVSGFTGPVYAIASNETWGADIRNFIVYGWNPCPPPGPQTARSWGGYYLGNLSPHAPASPSVEADFGNIDFAYNYAPWSILDTSARSSGRAGGFAVKIGNHVYLLGYESGTASTTPFHPSWDTNSGHMEFRVYDFEIRAAIDNVTCPELVGVASEGLHVRVKVPVKPATPVTIP